MYFDMHTYFYESQWVIYDFFYTFTDKIVFLNFSPASHPNYLKILRIEICSPLGKSLRDTSSYILDTFSIEF